MPNLQDLTTEQLMDITAMMLMQRAESRAPILTDGYEFIEEGNRKEFVPLRERQLIAATADGG